MFACKNLKKQDVTGFLTEIVESGLLKISFNDKVNNVMAQW